MPSGIQDQFTWNRNHIFASGMNKAILLVEWYGGTLRPARRRTSPKLIARDVELHLWLEPHVTLLRIYGAKARRGLNHSLIVPLGHLQDGVKQFFAIELALEPQSPGLHGVISAQWRYKERNKERIKELPVKELYMNYTYHMGLLRQPEDFYVHKHVKLLETPGVVKEAIRLFEFGDIEHGEWVLRRKGDELLISAARNADGRLLAEADMLYQLSEHYVGTYMNRNTSLVRNG
jgi:hypothetical protein